MQGIPVKMYSPSTLSLTRLARSDFGLASAFRRATRQIVVQGPV
jgi:hypothetical protein